MPPSEPTARSGAGPSGPVPGSGPASGGSAGPAAVPEAASSGPGSPPPRPSSGSSGPASVPEAAASGSGAPRPASGSSGSVTTPSAPPSRPTSGPEAPTFPPRLPEPTSSPTSEGGGGGAGGEAEEPATPRRPPTLEDFPATGPNALAEVWQRGLGLVLDSLLCLVPVTVALFVAIGPETLANESADSIEYPLWVTASFVVLLASYQIVALSLAGQTLAMWALGIRCARYVDGKKPTPSQAAIRSLLPAAAASAPFPVSVLQYVIYFSALFDPLRRAWHDQAGGTIIVRTR